jgi:AcrR family transcriptional regulator
MRRPDRRRQRTQTALREALIALILEKGYEAITVQDIVDRADLGRATFYLHYPAGKDELLLQIMEDVQQGILAKARLLDPAAPPPSLYAFQHASENADFYRAILGGGGAGGLLTRFQQSTVAGVLERLKQIIPPERQAQASLEMIATYVTGALNALLIWWLENDQPFPPEEMARRFQQMTQAAVQAMLNSDAYSIGLESSLPQSFQEPS